MTTRITMRVLAGLTLYAGFGLTPTLAVPPAPKAEDLAAAQPKYPGVPVSTPAPTDAAKCRVENVPGADGKPIGHVLLDPSNRVVRRFLAVGTADYNIKSFYLDGQEVYRETDANGNGKPDQFRWLGSNGSKWGLDPQETGRATTWARISPEEVSKELFEAIVAKDAKRIEALLPSDEDLKSLGLPPAEVAKVKARTAGAAQKLMQTAQAMNLSDKAKWVHVELTTPQTTPADAFGGSQDVVRHKNAGVLVDKGDGKAEVFQTGELLQIGTGWRVIDGPAPGAPNVDHARSDDATPPVPPEIQDLVKKLTDLKEPADPAGWPKFHTDRAAILEQVVAKLQGNAAQEQWLRQLLDAYATAAEGGVKEAGDRLGAWKAQIDKTAPKSPVAAFAAFKVLTAESTARTKAADTKAAEIAKVQTWWKEQLEAFVKDFPNVEETPEALFRLAMAHEFSGKDGEAAAKQWYGALAKNFAASPLGPQAAGAVRRLESEGQPFQLAGPGLNGTPAVDVAQLRGKVVIVYYWASWSTHLKPEAAVLTDLLKKHQAKGLEVVTVCMDADPKPAVDAINAAALPGVHVFQPGGALATQYGVMGPHVFLVGKDGKVANKNAQVPTLGDEVEKLLK